MPRVGDLFRVVLPTELRRDRRALWPTTSPCVRLAQLISYTALTIGNGKGRVSTLGWRYHTAMALPDYSYLYDHACERKGGEKALKALLPKTKGKAQLKKLGSDRYLAEFTRKIFQSGFVWRVVDKKWPQFEEVFWEFDVERLLMMPDDMMERKAKDPAIIRNFSKVKTVRENAMMIDDTERREQQSFGEFVAGWPDDDVIGLWLYLKNARQPTWVVTPGPSPCAHWVWIPFYSLRMSRAFCAAITLWIPALPASAHSKPRRPTLTISASRAARASPS